ncbi:glycosyltransferase [Priestia megaterium]|uniref:glycosyltransferase n=1 Tax=Priestia megaterium TaxID=1404 RepID=UPI0028772739|nr:glycosyltransferase family 2 protein [Priestia megaterium]
MHTFFITVFILCIVFPLFHIINALLLVGKKPFYMHDNKTKEQGISILVPCYNEESILQTCISGMRNLKYKNHEIIFINDGSSDETMRMLLDLLKLSPLDKNSIPYSELPYMPVKEFYQSTIYSNVKVIDKVNGGKADALNAGIACSSNELIITLDADSVLDESSLSIINKAFTDESVISAGGNVHILQGTEFENRKLIPALRKSKQIVRFQILEYLKGFYVLKASLARANALSIISGAFGVFRKEVLMEVGGYRRTIGEDIDITLKVQKYAMKHKGKKILFIPEAICYTEAPESWKDLYKQRIRWQKAFIDCFIIYFKTFMKTMFTNKVSFFFIFDSFLTGVLASYLTGFFVIATIVLFSGLTAKIFLIYTVTSVFANLFYAIAALSVSSDYGHSYGKKDFLALTVTIILDLLVYRFINLLTAMIGSLAYFVNKHSWNKVSRTGRKYTVESKEIVQKAN